MSPEETKKKLDEYQRMVVVCDAIRLMRMRAQVLPSNTINLSHYVSICINGAEHKIFGESAIELIQSMLPLIIELEQKKNREAHEFWYGTSATTSDVREMEI